MLTTLAGVMVKPKEGNPFVYVLDWTVQVTISITTGRRWLRASPISSTPLQMIKSTKQADLDATTGHLDKLA